MPLNYDTNNLELFPWCYFLRARENWTLLLICLKFTASKYGYKKNDYKKPSRKRSSFYFFYRINLLKNDFGHEANKFYYYTDINTCYFRWSRKYKISDLSQTPSGAHFRKSIFDLSYNYGFTIRWSKTFLKIKMAQNPFQPSYETIRFLASDTISWFEQCERSQSVHGEHPLLRRSHCFSNSN